MSTFPTDDSAKPLSEEAVRFALKFDRLSPERKQDAIAIMTFAHRNPSLFDELASKVRRGDTSADEFAEAAHAWLARNPAS